MRLLSLLCALVMIGAPAPAAAHEIPARVTVQAWLSPQPDQLRVLVRVPLEAMRDIEFPLRGDGFIDFSAAAPLLREAAVLWIASALGVREENRELGPGVVQAVRLSLPGDASFRDYDTALAHMAGSAPTAVDLPWQQALLDVLLEFPITSPVSSFSIEPTLAHLGITTTTVLRFVTPDGAVRVYQYVGDPGLVRLDPRWHHAAAQFVKLGFLHILEGLDHLLFLLCLVLPMRRFLPLLAVVSAFTVAHSITLIASALGAAPGGLWFPPLIETLIALSIVYMAFENIAGARVERRWVLAFVFGLVHGFGFSFLLRDSLQFAGSHLLASLVAFNLGVELGQVLVIALAVPALAVLFRRVPERVGGILISALVAHSAWHWMTERGAALREFSASWPALDAALLLVVLKSLLVLLLAAAALWGLQPLMTRLRSPAVPAWRKGEPLRPGAEPARGEVGQS